MPTSKYKYYLGVDMFLPKVTGIYTRRANLYMDARKQTPKSGSYLLIGSQIGPPAYRHGGMMWTVRPTEAKARLRFPPFLTPCGVLQSQKIKYDMSTLTVDKGRIGWMYFIVHRR